MKKWLVEDNFCLVSFVMLWHTVKWYYQKRNRSDAVSFKWLNLQ